MTPRRSPEAHHPPLSARQGLPVLLLLGVAAYLAARTFVAPGVPVLLGGDQGFFWMDADRMLHEERVYRDFFQFTPPGTDLVYLAAFALFGARVWVANAVVVLLGVALAGVCFRVASGVVSRSRAALATAIFVVLVFGHMLDATHHWFSVLFVMCAVAVVGPGLTPRRLVLAGALLGLASFFTQTHGAAALVAFVAFAAWDALRAGQSRAAAARRTLCLFVGFCGALLAAWAYFVVRSGAGPIFACVVGYVWRYVGRTPVDANFGLPEPLTWASLGRLAPYLLVYAIVAVAYVSPVVLARREGPGRAGARLPPALVLLWLVGVALLVEVGTKPSWFRLFTVSMPALILFVWALERLSPGRRSVDAVAWAVLAALACFFVRSTYVHHPVLVELPAGTAATHAANAEKLPWLVQHVPAGDAVFAANRPNLYLQLGLHNPLSIDAILVGGGTTAEHVERALRELDASRVRYLLWSPALDVTASGQTDPVLAPMQAYLHDSYRIVRTFSDGDEAWERK